MEKLLETKDVMIQIRRKGGNTTLGILYVQPKPHPLRL